MPADGDGHVSGDSDLPDSDADLPDIYGDLSLEVDGASEENSNDPRQKQLKPVPTQQPPPDGSMASTSSIRNSRLVMNPHPDEAHKCPRCDSINTKFCYSNTSLCQLRYFCKNCRQYWTVGVGSMTIKPRIGNHNSSYMERVGEAVDAGKNVKRISTGPVGDTSLSRTGEVGRPGASNFFGTTSSTPGHISMSMHTGQQSSGIIPGNRGTETPPPQNASTPNDVETQNDEQNYDTEVERLTKFAKWAMPLPISSLALVVAILGWNERHHWIIILCTALMMAINAGCAVMMFLAHICHGTKGLVKGLKVLRVIILGLFSLSALLLNYLVVSHLF